MTYRNFVLSERERSCTLLSLNSRLNAQYLRAILLIGSRMSFRLVPKSVTLNGKMALILRYIAEFGSFHSALRKIGRQSHNYGQFTITTSSNKRLQSDHLTPLYKYSITARWKLCSRFINSRCNAQYLPSYHLIC